MSSARFRDLDGRDAYEILGVAPTATRAEISRSRRQRQRSAHPDRGVVGDGQSKLINAAAAILLDEELRSEYDRWRDDAEPPPEQSPPEPAESARFRPGPRSPYRGVPDPVAPGAGPGAGPTYGDPRVMPPLGRPPPVYYREPGARRGHGGTVALLAGVAVLACCLVLCLVNACWFAEPLPDRLHRGGVPAGRPGESPPPCPRSSEEEHRFPKPGVRGSIPFAGASGPR